jgi:hypothetical protein
MARVQDAPLELVREAGQGPHKGWDTFDLKLEGARFHLLQQAVAAEPFDEGAARRVLGELESLAYSYGYGTADSYLTDASGMSDDEIEADPQLLLMRENIFENPEEDQYFHEVRVSGRILLAGAATAQARDFLTSRVDSPFGTCAGGSYGIVMTRMMKAFEAGRDERRNLDASKSPTP